MPEPVRPPQRLLEHITQQQAHVAALDRALQAAERAVVRADAGNLTRAHRRADDALLDLEAAKTNLERLIQAHTAAMAAPTPALPTPRRHRTTGANIQPTLFDLG